MPLPQKLHFFLHGAKPSSSALVLAGALLMPDATGRLAHGAAKKEAPPSASDPVVACRTQKRTIACTEQCSDSETRSSSRNCTGGYSKEKAKTDGDGCLGYTEVCTCTPSCPKDTGDIKL